MILNSPFLEFFLLEVGLFALSYKASKQSFVGKASLQFFGLLILSEIELSLIIKVLIGVISVLTLKIRP